jgi:hypothetical protein
MLSPARVLRPSTTLLLMAWLRLVGYANYFRSFTVLKLLSMLVYCDNINVVYLSPNLV